MSDTITTNSFNPEIFNQVNVEGLIRDVGEEEVMRLLKKVVENNQKILELQKQLVVVRMNAEKKRREQEKEWLRQKYNEKWKKEEQRKRQEEKDKRKNKEK